MTLDIGRIRALCFDVDGTLSDTDDLYVQKFARLLQPVRFLLPEGNTKRAARRLVMWSEAPGNILLGIPDTLGIDDEIAGIIDWLNRRRPRPMKHFILIPGVKQMLQELHEHFPMAVVSARDEHSTQQFLDQFGLTSLFQVVVTSVTAEHTKPYPDPIYFAAKEMNTPPEACLMIGDTTVDIRAGKSAGAQTVGVLCGFGEKAELHHHGADIILDSTAELTSTLLS